MTWFSLGVRLTLYAVLRPRVAVDLIALSWAFRALDWYRRPPFLPVPSRAYVRWRMYTAYGQEEAVPPIKDVVRFARWRRELMRV